MSKSLQYGLLITGCNIILVILTFIISSGFGLLLMAFLLELAFGIVLSISGSKKDLGAGLLIGLGLTLLIGLGVCGIFMRHFSYG